MKAVHVAAWCAAAALLSACAPTQAVPGTAAGTDNTPTTTQPATTEPPTAEPTTTIPKISIPTTKPAEPQQDSLPPSTVDESLPAQYCDRTFKGALGKPMHAVVVETPAGILNCEEAAAILFDYYAERPTPEPGLAPFFIGPLACNQADEGQLPQVICADEDNLIYAMWPQT